MQNQPLHGRFKSTRELGECFAWTPDEHDAMAAGDLVFATILLGSVPLAAVLRFLCPPCHRADASAIAGVAAALAACGLRGCLHLLGALVLAIAALLATPRRHRPIALFALAFGHLFLARCLPTPPSAC